MSDLETRCPVCGFAPILAVAAMDEARRARFLDFSRRKYGGLLDDWPEGWTLRVQSCARCGHCWLSPQPDETRLFAMYAAGRPLIPDATVLPGEPTPAMLEEMRRFRRMVGGAATPRLLDFGAGAGRWSRAAAAQGFAVTAYEPSAERSREAKDLPFESVRDPALLKGRRFEAINVEQVLEHVKDPLEILRFIASLAAPRALVRLTVPNVLRAPEGKALWQDWPFDGKRTHTLAPFEHLHGFTPASLEEAARRAGFRPICGVWAWFYAPVNQARRLAGRLAPVWGQTLLYARLSQADSEDSGRPGIL